MRQREGEKDVSESENKVRHSLHLIQDVWNILGHRVNT